MGSYSAFYVKSGRDAQETLSQLTEHLRAARKSYAGPLTVRQHPTAPWIEVESRRFVSEIPGLLRAVSAKLGTGVVGCDVVTTVTGLYLQRFRSGEETACFSFNHEQGWTIARGKLEPQVTDGLFSPTRLEEALEGVDSDAEAARVRKLFARREIELGSLEPFPDEWDCLARSLALSPEDVGGFRDAELRGVSHPLTIKGLRSWSAVNLIAWALVLGAFVLLFYAGRADRQDQVSFGLWRGSLLAWLGFGLLLRKGSIIVVFAGSFLAALVLMMVGLSLGNLSR